MVINVNGERPPYGGELRQAAGAAAAGSLERPVLASPGKRPAAGSSAHQAPCYG